MSTIKTETLSTPSNATVPVDTVVNGTAKAWVNFNGTGTVAIRRSFNVSSITDNGTGDYTVNLTTAMPDVNGTVTGATVETVGSFSGGLRCVMPSFSSTSSIRLGVAYVNGGTTDTPYIGIAVFS